MALASLFITFMVLGISVISCTLVLLLTKNPKLSDIMLIVLTVLSLVVAYMSATAQPVNFVKEQILAWIIGFVALVGLALRYMKKEQVPTSKLLVAASAISGVLYLFFS